MPRKNRQDPEIREFILRNIDENPSSIVSLAMEKFGFSRPGIIRYMQKLSEEGLLSFQGNTFARRYKLIPIHEKVVTLQIDHRWREDIPWREHILPLMKNVAPNIIKICHYGFTEMVNNVLDHSVSPDITIGYRHTYNDIRIVIVDNGIGIFQKIQNDFGYEDPRTALLELSKGKLTSDEKNHSGEGIYFTSRAFDRFRIRSGNLFYSREKRDEDDWLIEVNDRTATRKGTMVRMKIATDANWTMTDVFDTYRGDNWKFRRTHVPIKLMQYPGEQLVSRSQAKRLLTRFDNFSEVFLDFQDVDQIGQGFADEIFRVFRNANPEIHIVFCNASPEVKKMIEAVSAEKS